VDLTGGLDPELELFLTRQPWEPEMRDSATLWVMDEAGVLALPRVTVDAIASHWDRPWIQLNMVHADGRTFRVWERCPSHSHIGRRANLRCWDPGHCASSARSHFTVGR
jgi:hypothetical protein